MRKIFFFIALVYWHAGLNAHNNVVVVPLFDDKSLPIENIITVGLQNADFTDPVAAVESISDATNLEPYLVFIGPGTYTIGSGGLHTKPNVYLAGSGVGVTILEAGFGAGTIDQSAVVSLNGLLENESALRNLSIVQYGSSTGISSGVYATGFSSMDNVEIKVQSTGAVNYGVYLDSGMISIKDSDISVANASVLSTGIFANGGSHEFRNTEILSRDGTIVSAIYNQGARISVNSISATTRLGSNTDSLWGLYSEGSASTTVNYSDFSPINQRAITNLGGCHVNSPGILYGYFSTFVHGCSGSGDRYCGFAKGRRETVLNGACEE